MVLFAGVHDIRPVRLAGGQLFVPICSERKVVGCLMAGADLFREK
jgi:hypothetical protein